jgi:hypothetical protein
MTDDVKKALADKDAEIKKLQEELAKAGAMTEEQKAYHAKLDSDGQGKFSAMSHADRAAEMSKGTLSKRAEPALPEDVRKRLEQAEAVEKRLAALEDERELETFSKRAVAAGLDAGFGAQLRAIAKADPKAAEEVEKLGKKYAELLKTSAAFSEIGTSNGADASTAYGQLVAKGEEIAKRDKVTNAVGFTKACTENPDLYKQYRAESTAGQA